MYLYIYGPYVNTINMCNCGTQFCLFVCPTAPMGGWVTDGSCKKSFHRFNIFVRSWNATAARNSSPTVWRSTRAASESFPVGQREGATPHGRRTRRRSKYRPEAYPSAAIRELTWVLVRRQPWRWRVNHVHDRVNSRKTVSSLFASSLYDLPKPATTTWRIRIGNAQPFRRFEIANAPSRKGCGV